MVQIKKGTVAVKVPELFVNLQNTICSSSTYEELILACKSLNSWNYEDAINLIHWSEVLNKFDSVLTDISTLHDNLFVNVKDYVTLKPQRLGAVSVESLAVETAIAVLKATSTILRNSCSKEKYSSVETLFLYLRSYDDDLAEAALSALLSLVAPPFSHRYLDYCPHTTMLHKNSNLCQPIFALIECASFSLEYTAEAYCKNDFQCAQELKSVSMNSFNEKTCATFLFDASDHCEAADSLELLTIAGLKNLHDPGCSSKYANFSVSDDVVQDERSLEEIVADSKDYVTPTHLFSLVWTVRFKRWFASSHERRMRYLTNFYSCLCIALCSHGETAVITALFEDKSQILKDFVYFMRTAVRTDNSTVVPLIIRLLSVYCLTSLIGWSDSTSLFYRLTWLQNDLGIHRGQYMGLLPCLIRYCSNFLLTLNSSCLNSDTSMDQTSDVTAGIQDNLMFSESIFTLTMTLVSTSPNFLPSLTDSGVIASLTSIATVHPCANKLISEYHETGANSSNKFDGLCDCRGYYQVYIESLGIQVLDMAINNHAQAFSSFKELNGAHVVLERLMEELHYLDLKADVGGNHSANFEEFKVKYKHSNTSEEELENIAVEMAPDYCVKNTDLVNDYRALPAVNFPTEPVERASSSRMIVIQSLLSLLATYFYDGKQDSNDREMNQVLRCANLSFVLNTILRNAAFLGSAIIEPTHRLIGELINNDPSIPVVLTYLISAGIIESALLGILDSRVEYSAESLLGAMSLVSSIALTNEGKALLYVLNPFKAMFAQLRNLENIYPNSSSLMGDSATVFGGNIEEFIRYYGDFNVLIVPALLDDLTVLVHKTELLCNYDLPESRSSDLLNEYVQSLHCISNYMNCLEPLLLSKENSYIFLRSQGIFLLLRIFNVTLGPPKCLISVLCSLSDPSSASLGYTPILTAVKRCAAHVEESYPDECMQLYLNHLCASVLLFRISLDKYMTHNSDVKKSNSNSESIRMAFANRDLPINIKGFLSELVMEPLHNTLINGKDLTPELVKFAGVLRTILRVDYCIDAIVLLIQTHKSSLHSGNCIKILLRSPYFDMISSLFRNIYVPTLIEHHSAREQISRGLSLDSLNSNFVFRLLVLQNDVVVRETQDDNSKKVYKLTKGAIVDSFERVINSSNFLRYRVDGGWVSAMKGGVVGSDPQVVIIDIIYRPTTCSVRAADLPESINFDSFKGNLSDDTIKQQKRFDFEKYANIAPSRGGFMAFYRLHNSCKQLLSTLSRNFMLHPYMLNSFSFSPIPLTLLNSFGGKYFPIFALILDSVAKMTEPSLNLVEKHKKAVLALNAGKGNSVVVTENFFNSTEIPLLEEFNMAHTFAAMHAIDLFRVVFASDDRGSAFKSVEYHALLIYHTYESGSLHYVLQASVNLFMCSLYDENVFDNAPPTLSERNPALILRDRRIYAGSKVDAVIDFWKRLLDYCGRTTFSFERGLMETGGDYANFDPYVFKRNLFILVARYICPVCSHKLLHTALPSTVKSLFSITKLLVDSSKTVSLLTLRFANKKGKKNAEYNDDDEIRKAELSESEGFLNFMQLIGYNPDGFGSSKTTEESSKSKQKFDEFSTYLEMVRDMPVEKKPVEDLIVATQLDNFEKWKKIKSSLDNDTLVMTDTLMAFSSDENRTMKYVYRGGFPDFKQDQLREIYFNKASAPSANELTRLRLVANGIGTYAFSSILSSFLRILEYGTSVRGVQWNNYYISQRHKSFQPSEILVTLLQLLGKKDLSDASLKMIILSCLYRRAIALLQFYLQVLVPTTTSSRKTRSKVKLDVEPECLMRRLHNVLHAILLILTGKAFASARSENQDCVELMLTVFRFDSQFSPLYDLISSALSHCSTNFRHFGLKNIQKEFKDAANQLGDAMDPSSYCYNWVIPAFLIFDVFEQPIVIDRSSCITSYFELKRLTSMSAHSLYWGDDSILPDKGVMSPDSRSLYANLLLTQEYLWSTEGDSESTGSNTKEDAPPARKTRRLKVEKTDQVSSSKVESEVKEEEYDILLDLSFFGKHKKFEISEHIKCLIEYFSVASRLVWEAISVREETKQSKDVDVDQVISPSVSVQVTLVSLFQAGLQSLVHLTRREEGRKAFQEIKGIEKIMACSGFLKFEGLNSIILSLIQQLLEDKAHLAQAMEATIRLCMQRLLKSSSEKTKRGEIKTKDSSEVTLSSLIEVVSPLIYRDQRTFSEVFRNVCSVGRSSYNITTVILRVDNKKSESENSSRSRSKSNLDFESVEVVNKIISTPKGKKDVDLSLDPLVSTTPGFSLRPSSSSHNFVGSVSLLYTIVEDLVMMLVGQWFQLKEIKKYCASLKSEKSKETAGLKSLSRLDPLLSMPDLLILLSDLASYVPGVAYCLMRYHISAEKWSKLSNSILAFTKASSDNNGTPRHRSNSFRISSELSHCITGAGLPTSGFLSFLIHELIGKDHILPKTLIRPKVSMRDKSTKANSVTYHKFVLDIMESNRLSSEFGNLPLTVVSEFLSVGGSIADAGSYLIAGLLSRPGEGRKRVLNEMMSVVQSMAITPIITGIQLQSVASICKLFMSLFQPPSNWIVRDTFIVPTKELLNQLVQMKLHNNLMDAMCRVDCKHPYVVEIAGLIAYISELMIRRGLLLQTSLPAVSTMSQLAVTQKEPIKTDSSLSFALDQGNASVPTEQTIESGPHDHLLRDDTANTQGSSLVTTQDDDHLNLSRLADNDLDEESDESDSGDSDGFSGDDEEDDDSDDDSEGIEYEDDEDMDDNSNSDDEDIDLDTAMDIPDVASAADIEDIRNRYLGNNADSNRRPRSMSRDSSSSVHITFHPDPENQGNVAARLSGASGSDDEDMNDDSEEEDVSEDDGSEDGSDGEDVYESFSDYNSEEDDEQDDSFVVNDYDSLQRDENDENIEADSAIAAEDESVIDISPEAEEELEQFLGENMTGHRRGRARQFRNGGTGGVGGGVELGAPTMTRSGDGTVHIHFNGDIRAQDLSEAMGIIGRSLPNLLQGAGLSNLAANDGDGEVRVLGGEANNTNQFVQDILSDVFPGSRGGRVSNRRNRARSNSEGDMDWFFGNNSTAATPQQSAIVSTISQSNVPRVHPLLESSTETPMFDSSVFGTAQPSRSIQGATLFNPSPSVGLFDSVFGNQSQAATRAQNSTAISARRRAMGPLVSDRRWGTDVGEIDLVSNGRRLQALSRVCDRVLIPHLIPGVIEPPKESVALEMGKRKGKRKLSHLFNFDTENNSSPAQTNNEDLENTPNSSRRLRFHEPVMHDGAGEFTNRPPSRSGSGENIRTQSINNFMETFLSGMSNIPENPTSEVSNSAAVVPVSNMSLQNTTESSSDMSSSGADNLQCPPDFDETIWRALPREMQLELLETPGESSVNNDSSPPESSAIVPSTPVAVAVTQPTGPSENEMFVRSLPEYLRAEVLLTADNAFISSLSNEFQEEARAIQSQFRLTHGVDLASVIPTAMGEVDDEIGSDYESDDIVLSLPRAQSGVLPTTTGPAASEIRINSSGTGTTASTSVRPEISMVSDRVCSMTPYGREFVIRLLRILLTSQLSVDASRTYSPFRDSKSVKFLHRLLAIVCRYKGGRLLITHILSSFLSKDRVKFLKFLSLFPSSSELNSRKGLTVVAKDDGNWKESEDMNVLLQLFEISNYSVIVVENVELQVSSVKRTVLTLLSYLMRKVAPLVWYDSLQDPLFVVANSLAHKEGIFGEEDCVGEVKNAAEALLNSGMKDFWEEIFNSGVHPADRSVIDDIICLTNQRHSVNNENPDNGFHARRLEKLEYDYALRLLEEIFVPLRNFTFDQVDKLVEAQQYFRNSLNPGVVAKVTVGAKKQRLESIPEEKEDGEEPIELPLVPISVSKVNGEGHGKMSTASEVIPFPVLTKETCASITSLLTSTTASLTPILTRRIARIVRPLCLYDGNYRNILECLVNCASTLTAAVIEDITTVRDVLSAVACSSTATISAALAQPIFLLPPLQTLADQRLLQTFKLVMDARDFQFSSYTGTERKENDRKLLSGIVSKIRFDDLWDVLCECLDYVRVLEGIPDTMLNNEETIELPVTLGSRSVSRDTAATVKSSTDNSSQQTPVLSSLSLRFLPLIEAFFSVCGTTLVVVPTNLTNSISSNASSVLKRKRSGSADSEEDLNTAVPIVRSVSFSERARLSGVLSSPSSHTPNSSSSSMFTFSVPGDQFRKHDGYLQMQCLLQDCPMSEKLLDFAERNKILINKILKQNISLLESSFSVMILVPLCRHLLSFDVKRLFFKAKLKKMKQQIVNASGVSSKRLNVHRSSVFTDSFQKLAYISADEMRKKLYVSFYGEEGLDAGGVTREWYSVLAREIFNPNYVLFSATADGTTFQPNPDSYYNPEHLAYFKFVGRIIGKAVSDGHLLDAHFTRSFYKHILGIPVNYHDMEAIDPDYYKSLKQMLEIPLDVLGIDLTMTAETNNFGELRAIDLVPNGKDIPVTDENKYDYVRLIAQHRMTIHIRKQIDSFLEGFHEIIPAELISIFDAQELELLISGLPDIDLDDLRAHTDYHGFKPTDNAITYFWNALKSFSKEEIALFLQFVTGSSKVPLEGFRALQGSEGIRQFNIHKAYGVHLLPAAHTCFNQLDLPEYSSEEMMREKLLTACQFGSEGFGFA